MIELEDKWFWAYPTESVDCDVITGSALEVYSKSDADAVIAYLQNQLALARTSSIESLAKAHHESLNNKYKRCLAMASYWLAVSYQCVDDKHRQRAVRHRRKWLELSEKFKDKE